jgi:cysteinyl-tRNA synthetase
MSMKLLGVTLDIHGGGLDLQFPHHENELAQSESYSGNTFARYWMHNGLIKVGTGKMSKSQGNEVVVKDVLERHKPETLRFFLLASHYRRPIDYSHERLEETDRAMQGFYRLFERFERITGEKFADLKAPEKRADFDRAGASGVFLNELGQHRAAFLECMDDDFNTGGAVGCLHELLTTLNRFADTERLDDPGIDAAKRSDFRRGVIVLKEMSNILGIFRGQKETGSAQSDKLLNDVMQLLLDLRADARKNKNFAMADQIRQRLTQIGVTLEDRAGGSGWRRS